MNDKEWGRLLRRIELGKCTPFLGAGVGSEVLPLGGTIAREWAERYEYPLGDRDDAPETKYEQNRGTGITNRPLDEEIDNQKDIPARGQSKPGAHAS